MGILSESTTHFDTINVSMDLCGANEAYALSDSKLPRSEDGASFEFTSHKIVGVLACSYNSSSTVGYREVLVRL
jgi:hypothetical protein